MSTRRNQSDHSAAEELSNHLRKWMECTLEEHEFALMVHRYGLFGFPKMTIDHLAQQLGVQKDLLLEIGTTSYEKLQKTKLSPLDVPRKN